MSHYFKQSISGLSSTMLINKDSFRSQQEVNDEGGVILQSISTTNLCKRRGVLDKKGRGVSGPFPLVCKI